MTGEVVVRPARFEDEAAIATLFDHASCPCHCRYWHFDGDKNAWLDRCTRPEDNRAEMARALAADDPSAQGLIAVDDVAAVVGWMKLCPLAALPKLRRLPVYRSLTPREGTWAVGCFLVRPDRRRHGVAQALVDEAARHAARIGATAIEGYPRRASSALHDEQAWLGPEAIFVRAGFDLVHDAPYPVYRKVFPAVAG